MTTLTLRAASVGYTAAAVPASSYGSITITKPTGTTNGDVLTMFTFGGRSGFYLSDAESQGWERIYSNSGLGQAIFQKLASGEPASYTFQTDGDSTGHIFYPHAGGAVMACWAAPTLAYDESYPFTSGFGWWPPSGGTNDYAPSPIGWDDVGDTTDTSTRRYLDIVAMLAVTSGTTTGAAYSVPTISGYTGTHDETFGAETLLPEIDFGGGFKSRWRWGLFAHADQSNYSFKMTYTGGSGNYLMTDQPGNAWQAYLTVDPLAVPIWNADYGDGARLDYTAKTVAVRALPHDIGRLLRRT